MIESSHTFMKRYLICILLIMTTTVAQRSLEHCINHILHESGNEDFQCHNNEELHFYSTYVLPDGADKCLSAMIDKQGFFVSTIR